jgi:hypothetical protein
MQISADLIEAKAIRAVEEIAARIERPVLFAQAYFSVEGKLRELHIWTGDCRPDIYHRPAETYGDIVTRRVAIRYCHVCGQYLVNKQVDNRSWYDVPPDDRMMSWAFNVREWHDFDE